MATEIQPDPEAEENGQEISIGRIELFNILLILAAALASGYFLSPEVAVATLVGGAMMAVSFNIIKRVVVSVTDNRSREKRKSLSAFIYWLKFTLMMMILGVLILYFEIHVGGLLIGLSMIVPAIILETVLKLAKS